MWLSCLSQLELLWNFPRYTSSPRQWGEKWKQNKQVLFLEIKYVCKSLVKRRDYGSKLRHIFYFPSFLSCFLFFKKNIFLGFPFQNMSFAEAAWYSSREITLEGVTYPFSSDQKWASCTNKLICANIIFKPCQNISCYSISI